MKFIFRVSYLLLCVLLSFSLCCCTAKNTTANKSLSNEINAKEQITKSELKEMNALIQKCFLNTQPVLLTKADFDRIKEISNLKEMEINGKNYAYNIYIIENKKLCLFYVKNNGTWEFEFSLFFEDVQSYDELNKKNNTYKNVKSLTPSLYSDIFEETSYLCSSLLANKIDDIDYTTEYATSHLTDEGILYLDYDGDYSKNESGNNYKILHSEILDGDYMTVYESLVKSLKFNNTESK